MKTNTDHGFKNGGNGSANGQLTKYIPPASPEKAVEGAFVPTVLTQEQKTELTKCELVIMDGVAKMYEAGRALMTIREEELYKDKYRTFDDYCRERWGYSKSHANRLIGAAGVVDVLTPIGAKVENESQVRALTGLKPAKVEKAWEKATKLAAGGKVTANLVRRAVNEVTGRPEQKRKPSKNATALTLLNKLEDAVNQDLRTEAIKLLRRIRKLLTA